MKYKLVQWDLDLRTLDLQTFHDLRTFHSLRTNKVPSQAFFDKISAETERQFFAKLRKIAETEKYEIFRPAIFCIDFSRRQKECVFH